MTKNILLVIQIILSLFLIFLIVVQSKGSGISSSLMGGSQIYSTKRGVEKAVFNITILIAVLFFISSVFLLAVN
ncbi:preprotein translocase subunit SecG [Candidatus Shapirobacteria bacterium CG03_land_8_20_14_0_80_40_19]|uniref:Protein-export membrane protein SecG n=1 Tax=Candidatus Shapirobacteria bacterium CG03_land_8_20_14_0_80_40_19 TaxID=1974880 RepID=A0A2M7BGN5_9BACT|nr:MAG: preprotein translocase subunit SecG [Candidatus Shapirobacteria bacterium CG03_land_8_20_14_0_80_40_19]